MPDTPAASFGPGLAARVRPRLSAPHRLRRSSAIGAVGRSTLGFGRIIATAGSSRPIVTPDVLATRSLRPPVGAWSLFGADDEPAAEITPWTTRAVTPATAVRRAPAAPAPKPAPSRQPKGAGQVDALRRMLEARGMIEPSTDTERDAGTAAPTRPATASPAGRAIDPAAPGDRSATSAGTDTAPGRFGHRVRPEPTAPESPLSSVFPEGAPSPSLRRSPQARGGDDLDRFRRSLETRGMLESSGDGTPQRSAGPRAAPPADAARGRRPRASERSTPSRPESTRGADGEGDSDGVPAAPGRALPFALAPESSPAPTRHRLRRAVEPGDVTTEPNRVDATLGAAVAPGVAVIESSRPDLPARSEQTSAPAVAPTGTTPARAQTPIAASPAATTATTASRTDDIRRTEIRRVELRRLSHRIGLERTLATRVADDTATPSAAPISSTAVAPPPGAKHTPDVAPVRRSADPLSTPPNARPATNTTVGDVAGSDTSTRRSDTRAPIVVTRASEARVATRNVRHRMAGRRFAEATTPEGAAAPAGSIGSVAPAVMSAGSPPAAWPAASPAASASSAFTHGPVVRSAVAAGPGALARALRTPGAEPAHAATRAAPEAPAPPGHIARSPEAPTPGRTVSTTPPASTPTPGTSPGTASNTPSNGTSTSNGRSPARPDVPDPAELAASTASHLASTAPGVITRSPAPDTPAGAAPATAAPTAASPAGDLGERFLRELGRAPDQAARDLPTPFRPLATAITGSARQTRISSDRVSRQALDAVGKRAVTVGDTIHVAHTPRPDARTYEILAHELVHVANPSPTPRFFDDDHRGPEERTAERVAQVIARSPVMPSAPVPSNRAPSTGGTASPIRRAPAAGASRRPASSPGSIDAAALAASIEGSSSGGTIRRAPEQSGGLFDSVGNWFNDLVGGNSADPPPQSQTATGSDTDALPVFGSGTREERDWFDHLIERTIDQVVRRVEERVVTELERRGGRYWRNF